MRRIVMYYKPRNHIYIYIYIYIIAIAIADLSLFGIQILQMNKIMCIELQQWQTLFLI